MARWWHQQQMLINITFIHLGSKFESHFYICFFYEFTVQSKCEHHQNPAQPSPRTKCLMINEHSSIPLEIRLAIILHFALHYQRPSLKVAHGAADETCSCEDFKFRASDGQASTTEMWPCFSDFNFPVSSKTGFSSMIIFLYFQRGS